MKSKIDGFMVLSYRVTNAEQRVEIQLLIKGEPVDIINIDITKWATVPNSDVLKLAYTGAQNALFDSEIEISTDDEPPILF